MGANLTSTPASTNQAKENRKNNTHLPDSFYSWVVILSNELTVGEHQRRPPSPQEAGVNQSKGHQSSVKGQRG